MGKNLTLFNIFLLPFAIFAAIAGVDFILNNFLELDSVTTNYVKAQVPQDFSFEGKICFISKGFSFCALYLFALIISTIISRILTFSPNPQVEADNSLITALNKSIQNTIDQSYVFFALYSYWLLTIAKKGDDEKAVLLIVCFLVSRIFFTIGMIIEYFTKISFVRQVGIVINIVLIAQFTLLISGKDSYFALYSQLKSLI